MAVRSRGVAAVIVAGVAALCAFASPVATAAPAAAPVRPPVPLPTTTEPAVWAPARTAAIHPGVLTETDGGGACTSNFVFTSGDRTFLGQAAHCAGTGAATETDGCDSATRPLGTPVTIKAADGTDRTGTLAYSSWVRMQENGESDPTICAYNDFALVEIAPEDVPDVNPSIPFFGGPTGIDTDGLAVGEQVFGYGNSPLRMGAAALRPKAGANAAEVGGGRGHEIYTVSPGIPGDSGSAFLDDQGDAVGLLSTLNLAPLPVSNGVSDIADALDYANANGGLGDVELVLGTEPFTPAPPGVPAAALAGPAGPPVN